MKVSELIGLGPVSIDVGSNKFENLAKGSQRGGQVAFHR
jgi:hypothetical protein